MKKILVAVSGGFDPIHIGHVRLFEAAKKLGNELVVILNNDHWLKKKKGYIVMEQADRKKIIEAFRAVDRVVLSKHRGNDMSIVRELKALRPQIFANGGDRKPGNLRTEEGRMCAAIGCREIFNVGGKKIRSSSKLIEYAFNKKHR
ncbi:MAG: adenylyltransferase/cytidyltransferase family protein [Patescibacteria group bacterium]